MIIKAIQNFHCALGVILWTAYFLTGLVSLVIGTIAGGFAGFFAVVVIYILLGFLLTLLFPME